MINRFKLNRFFLWIRHGKWESSPFVSSSKTVVNLPWHCVSCNMTLAQDHIAILMLKRYFVQSLSRVSLQLDRDSIVWRWENSHCLNSFFHNCCRFPHVQMEATPWMPSRNDCTEECVIISISTIGCMSSRHDGRLSDAVCKWIDRISDSHCGREVLLVCVTL